MDKQSHQRPKANNGGERFNTYMRSVAAIEKPFAATRAPSLARNTVGPFVEEQADRRTGSTGIHDNTEGYRAMKGAGVILGTAIGRIGATVGMVLVLLMTLHITAETVSRLVFGQPLVGTIEIVSYYYMIAIAFAPLGFAQEKHEHIEAEVFNTLIPARVRGGAEILGYVLSSATVAALLYASFLTARRQTGFGEAILTTYGELPTWPGRWLVVIGFLGMLTVMIYQLATGRTRPPPAEQEELSNMGDGT